MAAQAATQQCEVRRLLCRQGPQRDWHGLLCDAAAQPAKAGAWPARLSPGLRHGETASAGEGARPGRVVLLVDLMALSAGTGAWLPRHRKVRGLLRRLVCILAGAWLQQPKEGGKQRHSSHCKI